jgi:non-ribosomal peptide synthetase component E (peptide arylation enzyme)
VTHAGAGPVFHKAYLEAQRAAGSASIFPRIRAFQGGGAQKSPQLHFDLQREIGGRGIISVYGMTECPIISLGRMDDSDETLAHTEGRVTLPDTELRVLRDDGSLAGPGEAGEILIRAPQLCRGYVDSSLDAAALDEDGFFRSGDIGSVDADGFVSVSGRLKDVIIRKGENISAVEVENLLARHPEVAEVAVIGLPDEERGERCCAVVVARDSSAPLVFDAMVAFLREEQLMLQKIPEQLELVDELPRNPSGKVVKKQLRERFTAN